MNPTILRRRPQLLVMISQLKEFFKLKNFLGTILIPLLSFLILGYFQRNVFDWTQLQNRGYERAIEVGGYLLIFTILYVLASPIIWFRPLLNVKIFKKGSANSKPNVSEVFDLARREDISDVTIELEFTPSFWTRVFAKRADSKELGIEISWNPPNLLSCAWLVQGDRAYSEISDSAIRLYPMRRFNLYNSNSIKYSFRFALGTSEFEQQTRLSPRHINWKSRLLFALNRDSEFIFEIKDSRSSAKTVKSSEVTITSIMQDVESNRLNKAVVPVQKNEIDKETPTVYTDKRSDRE